MVGSRKRRSLNDAKLTLVRNRGKLTRKLAAVFIWYTIRDEFCVRYTE